MINYLKKLYLISNNITLNGYVEIGSNLDIKKSKDSKIEIFNNVKIKDNTEIRVDKKSSLKINDNVKIDKNVRIIVTNGSDVVIGENTNIGYCTVMNCGSNLSIGKKCLISGFVYIQCSDHGTKKNKYIKDQNHTHEDIIIGDDVWIGAHSTILKGTNVLQGSVIGSNTVVYRDTEAYSINFGVPSRKVNTRK